MKNLGFNRLSHSTWEKEHQDRIDQLFNGLEKDWLKKSLASVRLAAKEDLLLRQRSRCAYCRRLILNEAGRCELDHVIPKSALPQFTYHRLNLVASCKRCNHRKREHNPMTRKNAKRVSYPICEDDYIWVHPYIHRYNDHIKINAHGFFVPVAASPKGLAVIKSCGLDTMQQAEAVRTRAIVISHSKFNDALIELVSTSPNATNEALALALQHRTGPKVPLDYLVEQVKVYRAGQSALIRKIRISQANSSYAKYLK